MPKPRQTATSRCPRPISTHEHERRRQRHRHSRRPEPHARPAPTRRSPHSAGNIGWTRSTTSRRTRIFQPMKPRRSGSSSPRRKGRLPGSWRRPPSVLEIGTAQAEEASGHAIRRRSRQGRVFIPASARPRRPCEPPTTPVSSDFPFYHAGTGRLEDERSPQFYRAQSARWRARVITTLDKIGSPARRIRRSPSAILDPARPGMGPVLRLQCRRRD
jgi:hypothetical protein